MKKLTLAVISDMHVGEGSRAKDLCPSSREHKTPKPDDNYRGKFLDFVSKQGIKADYLLLPGDVTDGAQPDEVQIASEFIVSAADALGVAGEKIVFVPGNHDVDWEVMKIPDSTNLRHLQRYDPLRQESYHFKKIMDGGTGDILADPHFTLWQFDDLLVVGYNSAHHDDPNQQHYGLVDPKHIGEMREAIEKIAISPDQVRLFLVHHHPIQYSDPTSEEADLSVMVNAEELHEILREFKFDILVHGHKHLPRFTTRSVDGSPEIAFLCSGSFSVQIDTRWAGTINNQFHLITIDGRDPDELIIRGQVRSWTYYYSRGWEPSEKKYAGIPHVEPFGTYTRPVKLEALLRPLLADRFKNADFVQWISVVSEVPGLKHLRPEIVVSVLDTLAPEFNYRRLGETSESIILLKD